MFATGDPADAVHVTERRQPGKFLGRAQAHGTIATVRVRAVPEAAATATAKAATAAKVNIIGGGGAHCVHPDVVQQLQRRRLVHGHHGQLVRVRRRLLLHDHVAAAAATVTAADERQRQNHR